MEFITTIGFPILVAAFSWAMLVIGVKLGVLAALREYDKEKAEK